MPSPLITNSARSEVPSLARYAPKSFATSPLGSKSARSGKCNLRSRENAAWHHGVALSANSWNEDSAVVGLSGGCEFVFSGIIASCLARCNWVLSRTSKSVLTVSKGIVLTAREVVQGGCIVMVSMGASANLPDVNASRYSASCASVVGIRSRCCPALD